MLQTRYTHNRSARTKIAHAPLPRQLTSHILFLVGRLGNIVREEFDQILGPYRIHCKHYAILSTLADKKRFTQQNLADILRIDRTSMTELINELEKSGLVGRHLNPADRRSHLIRTTARGQDVYKKTSHAAKAMEKIFLKQLDNEEARVLQKILDKLLHKILKTDGATTEIRGH